MRCEICNNSVNDMERHIRKKRCFDYFARKEEGKNTAKRGKKYLIRRDKLTDKDVISSIRSKFLERTNGNGNLDLLKRFD